MKHWQKWSDPRFIVLVLNNRDLNYVTWEQRVMEGEPKFEESQTLPDFPFARYAELLGFKGIKVDSPEKVGPAWDEALAADRPVVIEAWVNADVPTVPPTLTKKQAEAAGQGAGRRRSGRGRRCAPSLCSRRSRKSRDVRLAETSAAPK